MVHVRIKGVNRVRKPLRGGGGYAIYYYHRATKTRLEGDPGSPEFLAAYARAENLTRDRLKGTFSGLASEFTASSEFTSDLAVSTQASYKRSITKAEAKFGDLPIVALNDPRVRHDFGAWHKTIARTSGPREADNRLSAVSAMLTWAVETREPPALDVNHVKGFKRVYHADRADKIWLPEHFDAFMKVAPVEMQRALIVALHTGLRQGDIRRLAWSAYDGSALTLRISKNQRKGRLAAPTVIPCTKTLRGMLDGMQRSSPLILTTAQGRAWKARHFGKQWDLAAQKAGLAELDLHFNDLRGTAVTMLAEAGCTIPLISAITKHSLKSAHTIFERYMARTRHMADQAIALFENAPATKFANRLQTGPQKGARRKAPGVKNG
jgi:integrase